MSVPEAPAFRLPTEADEASARGVLDYLARWGLADRDESLSLERAGPSNMNRVWRARLANRSYILKQARPWVEKYPSIAAPVERAEAEARFYRLAATQPTLAERMPMLVHHDPDAHLLVLGDLAPVTSLEVVYGDDRLLTSALLADLARLLTLVHRLVIPGAMAQGFRNTRMRALNHAHLFDLPLKDEGVFDVMLEDVTPGLGRIARECRADQAYVAKVRELGRRYVDADRPTLIHGDVFFGSLLLDAGRRLFLIDPEFSFGGDPEFDLGVVYAHLLLAGQPPRRCREWLELTLRDADRCRDLVMQFAGVEIMRRLIGVAQLPVALSLEDKRELLRQSRDLVLLRGASS